MLAAVGGGVWAWNAGLLGQKSGSGDAIDMGVAEATVPQRSKLVTTTAFGQVPANQIGIMLKDGAGRGDAETVVKDLNGSLVGEIEFIDTFQVQFPGSTEADLNKALATARANDKVQPAFVNQQVYEDAEIKGVRVTPSSDPMYQGAAGDRYRPIGLDKAWAYIKGSGVELDDVHVGIVDDGLFPGGECKESEFGGGVEVDYPDPAAGGHLPDRQSRVGPAAALGADRHSRHGGRDAPGASDATLRSRSGPALGGGRPVVVALAWAS